MKKIEKKIVLSHGRQLAPLMVDFGIGVNTVSSYKIVRADGDYFTRSSHAWPGSQPPLTVYVT